MKRYLFGLIMLLLTALAVVSVPIARADVLHGPNPQVAANQTIDDDLFIAGNNVEVDGVVNGDVYAAGQSITIRGTVNGDVIAAGQDILIAGSVKGSVRVAGNAIRLSGAQVAGSFSAAGASVTAEKDSTIGGGAQVAGSSLALRAPVARGLQAAGSNVVVDNSVGRTADVSADTLTLASNAKINGNLNYNSKTDLVKDQGAQVTGSINKVHFAKPENTNKARGQAGFLVWSLFAMALIGVVLIWLAPTALPGVANAIIDRPVPSFGWGLLVLILTIPIAFIFFITVIGIPLAVMMLIAFGVVIYLSKIFLSLVTGIIVAERTKQPENNIYLNFFVGLLILTLIELIPYLGGIITFLVIVFALGGVAVYGRQRMRRVRA